LHGGDAVDGFRRLPPRAGQLEAVLSNYLVVLLFSPRDVAAQPFQFAPRVAKVALALVERVAKLALGLIERGLRRREEQRPVVRFEATDVLLIAEWLIRRPLSLGSKEIEEAIEINGIAQSVVETQGNLGRAVWQVEGGAEANQVDQLR